MLRCGTSPPVLPHPPLHILGTLLPRKPVLNPSQGKSRREMLGSVSVVRAVLHLDACGSTLGRFSWEPSLEQESQVRARAGGSSAPPPFIHGLSHVTILGLTIIYVIVVRMFIREWGGVDTSPVVALEACPGHGYCLPEPPAWSPPTSFCLNVPPAETVPTQAAEALCRPPYGSPTL